MSKPLAAILLMLAGPAFAQQSTAPALPGVVATTNNPNLMVSAVRLEGGQRLTQIIGASVFADNGERIGAVDDLVMVEGDKVTVAIVAVGGFLGLGSKLIAVPYQQLKRDADRLVLPGVSKDALGAMPEFKY